MTTHMPTEPSKSLQLVKALAEHGLRLFSLSEMREVAALNHLDIKDGKNALYSLASQGWIHNVKRGLYALDSIFLAGQPIHEFEIATRLVTPSAISHLSAFHHHELTDQIPQIIYATTISGSWIPRYRKGQFFIFRGVRYRYVQVKPDYFFGIEYIWKNEAKIPITDIERTLLDGLIKPKYCAGFREVLHAFSMHTFNDQKIIEYALRLDISVIKRLGWVLEYTGIDKRKLELLAEVPVSGYIKLDPSNENSGQYNKKWKIRENG